MPTAYRLGRDAKLYVNTASFGSPTWSAIDNVSDLTLTAEWDEAEASTRESKMKLKVKTLAGVEVSGKLKFDLTDTNTGTLLDAMVADTVIDVLVLNGTSATNGARGFRFECQVHAANEDQGLGAVVFEDFKLKPVPSANAKQSAKVASGAPVFTAF